MVKKFAQNEIFPSSLSRDSNEFFDRNIFKKLGELGILGITIPSDYGGCDMDTLSSVIVHEELGATDPSIALSYLAHSVLCVNNISANCNTEQKKRFLPSLCSGEHIGSMALSESDAGSDVLSMKTVAEKVPNGYIINGNKMWITNGVIDNDKLPSDVVYLYCKIKNDTKIATFLVDKDVMVGQKIKHKLGMRGSPTSELIFDNCFVPDNNVVSLKSSIKNMMRNLQIERITLGAISLGIARYSLNKMISYSNERKTFGKYIHNYGQIQQHIADSYSEFMACKSYMYNIAYNFNVDDYNARIDTDGIKLITSKVAKTIADRAIQVLGGNGYIGEYHVERFWRDAKLLEIGGGTNEILQKNMVKDFIKCQTIL
jgi:isovaleryl-CoA dehydrogenase